MSDWLGSTLDHVSGARGILALCRGPARWLLRRYLSGRVVIFPDRKSLDRAYPLDSTLRGTEVAYGLFISGQGVLRTVSEDLIKRVRQIVMPHPDLPALRNIQGSLQHIGELFDLNQEIRTSTATASRLGIEVRWYQEFVGITALIGDPKKRIGWAHVELCLPHMHPNMRPAFRLERKRDTEMFDRLWATFEHIWASSKSPNP